MNTVPGAQSGTEDVAKVFSSGNSNQISIADVDAGANSVSVTLTALNGTVTLATTANIGGSGNGTSTVVILGTIPDINTAMNGMSFRGTANFNSTRGSNSLTILTNDQGFTGTPGALSDSDTVTITLAAVNDPPVATTQSFLVHTNMQRTITVALSGAGGLTDPTPAMAGTRPRSRYRRGKRLLRPLRCQQCEPRRRHLRRRPAPGPDRYVQPLLLSQRFRQPG